MSLTELVLIITITNFLIRFRDMQSMLRTLQEFDLDSNDEVAFVRKKVMFFLKISIFYYVSANCAATNADIVAAFSPVDDPILPFRAWVPQLDWRHDRIHYWIVFWYQSVGMFITCNLNVTMELFSCFLTYVVSCQMEILGMRLARLGYAQESLGVDAAKPARVKSALPGKKNNEDYLKLTNHIKMHQDITM